jgi:hydroxymethylpyrimidine/phosphomethylpyrimidine kinase
MVAKSGDRLLERAATGALRENLLPLATMMTPNLPEAGILLGSTPADNLKDMRRMAEKLRRLMADDEDRWVFLKGGHLPGNSTIDILHNGDKLVELPGQRIDTVNTHGTGCTLSAALAALLPQSSDVPEAARRAKAYLEAAIAQSGQLAVGGGHGPVHHFHAWWGQ